MKKQEYNELVDKVVNLIVNAIGEDKDMKNDFEDWTEPNLRVLPKHKETIRTMQGIIGFHKYIQSKPAEERNSDFLFNALHDVYECIKNYDEKWYSPRLSRYVNFKSDTENDN